jgi:hypothetical protein
MGGKVIGCELHAPVHESEDSKVLLHSIPTCYECDKATLRLQARILV